VEVGEVQSSNFASLGSPLYGSPVVSRESADFWGPDVWSAETCNCSTFPAPPRSFVPYPDVHYVYVLRSAKDGNLYTGYTTDLRQRLTDHTAGRASCTRDRRPFQLIYYKAYLLAKDAKARELFLKRGSGKRFIRKQLRHYFSVKITESFVFTNLPVLRSPREN